MTIRPWCVEQQQNALGPFGVVLWGGCQTTVCRRQPKTVVVSDTEKASEEMSGRYQEDGAQSQDGIADDVPHTLRPLGMGPHTLVDRVTRVG
jgi:hypothetical protein